MVEEQHKVVCSTVVVQVLDGSGQQKISLFSSLEFRGWLEKRGNYKVITRREETNGEGSAEV